MKPILIEEEAESELIGAINYYEARRPGLGVEFELVMHEAVVVIQRNPERYPTQGDGTRRMVIERFPFVIYYLDLPGCLWIVAFAHTSRKPGYWRSRLR